MLVRANALVDSGRAVEASHYLNNILLDIIENYVWLKSLIDRVKVDYTTLIRSLEGLEEKNPRNYEQIVSFLDLDTVGKADATHAISETRDVMLKIRGKRKTLINNCLNKK
jgi:hypothetical protein